MDISMGPLLSMERCKCSQSSISTEYQAPSRGEREGAWEIEREDTREGGEHESERERESGGEATEEGILFRTKTGEGSPLFFDGVACDCLVNGFESWICRSPCGMRKTVLD